MARTSCGNADRCAGITGSITMNLDLAGKVALVTGSSQGIGRRTAALLQTEGCEVILNSRNETDLREASNSLSGATYFVGDMTNAADAKRVLASIEEKFGRLDILVCNVGSGRSVPPGEEDSEEWRRVFELNLWSTTNVVKAAQPLIIESQGAIVCISSICGVEFVPGAPVTYSSAKAALNSYIHGISRPLGKHGVRINGISPGNILFEGSVWSRKLKEDPQAVHAMLERDVALRRLGSPLDVANLVAYLASPVSGFVTGSVWCIDGGQVRS